MERARPSPKGRYSQKWGGVYKILFSRTNEPEELIFT
jgi:hypothetical protein